MNPGSYFGTAVKPLYTTLLILFFLACFTSSAWGITLHATYRGMTEDKVGRGSHALPNGEKDGHITLRLELGSNRRVVNYIMLEPADLKGNPVGNQVWDTGPNRYQILGVYRAQRQLNPLDSTIYDIARGTVHYDIYANDSGWFRSGQNFRVTVRFAEGDEAIAFCMVTASY